MEDKCKATSPSSSIQNGINNNWGGQKAKASPQAALAGSPTKHPVNPSSIKK